MKKLFFSLFFVSIFSLISFGQLTVQNGQTGQQLGEVLSGDNIQVTNASISGNAQQYGTFTFSGDGLEVNSGVILSTGSIFDAHGPNNSEQTSTSFGGNGNNLLSALCGQETQDATVLEFDFDVQSDEIEFNFIFLSEEYNEWVGSSFNDVFAFYISGPGIVGEENLAVIPRTTTPVSINTINNISFWQFFFDNTNNNTNIEFDGFTTLMTATKTGLQSCNTYTLKLMIADAGDDLLDAAVLLQENSLIQANISASSSTFSNNNTALEGCINADFNFTLDRIVDYDVEIPILVGGTAINGVDYRYVDSLIIIPAGQTQASIIIDSYADGLTEGQEEITIKYSPGACQPPATVSLFIDDYSTIEFTTSPTDATCNGGTGDATFSLTGGLAPYIITLTDTLTGTTNTYTTNPITGLAVGTYFVEIIDGYGCPAEDIVYGNEFGGGEVFIPDGNGETYSTTINVSGFTAGQTLTSVDQFQSVFINMEHSFLGELEIILQAPDGTQVKLKKHPGGATANLGEPVACGHVDQCSDNLTPGIGYDYYWTNNPTYGTMKAESSNYTYTYQTQIGTTETDKYLPSGSYESSEPLSNLIGVPLNGNWSIIVSDNNPNDNGYIFSWGLSLSASTADSIFTISEPDLTEVTTSFSNPNCGENNGSIDITVTGTQTPYTFDWNTGATSEDLTNISSGTYSVDVMGADNCVYNYSFNLSDNGTLVLSASSEPETCVDANNGSIDLSVTGGTPDFTYSWDNGTNTEDLSNLAPDDYTVTVNDAGGCAGIETFTVSEAVPIMITGTLTHENCNDREGAIDISVSGGISPYQFSWSNGEIIEDINELQQGDYTVTITDANSCTQSKTFTIVNYVGNCIPDCDLTITNETITNETCGQTNGSIDLTIFTSFSPYQVEWTSGATTDDITGLVANDYSVTITDAEGCEVIQNYTIANQTSGLDIINIATTNETCGNGQGAIDLTINGGALPYSFDWSNGETTEDLDNLDEGNYSITITDANGCAVNTNITLINDAGDLLQTWGNAINETCGNSEGSIDFVIEGGNPFGDGGMDSFNYYIYQWSNGATTKGLTNLSAGTYSCVVTDEDGCQITTDTYTIENEGGNMNIDYIDLDNEICGNGLGEIELIISGGTLPYTSNWNTGQTTQDIFNLSAGTYSNIISDANGCFVSTNDLIIINESGTLALTNISTTDEICNNNLGAIDITIGGGTSPYNFIWNTGSSTEDLNVIRAGNYNCLITDLNGCEVSLNTTINNDNRAIAIQNIIITDETCGNTNGSVDVMITGAASPVSYIWSSGQTTEDLSNISAGNYNCIITDNIGCQTTANVTILNDAGTLSLDNSIVTNEQCGDANGSINLIVSGDETPISFNWDNGATTEDITNLSAGTYSCVIIDNIGCTINTPVYAINNTSSAMSIDNVLITDETCENVNGGIDISILGGTAPITYLWDNGATTQDLSNISAGLYNVTITDATNCSISKTYEVINNAGSLAITSFVTTDEICGNGTGAIDITVNGDTPINYLWSNGAITEDLTGLSTGLYNVTITDNSGCEITSSDLNILNDAGNFALTGIDVVDEHCGDGTGSITVGVENGTGTITYYWSNGETTINLINLNQGTYNCLAIDENNCELSYFATVNNIEGDILVSNETIVAETCGDLNGAISIDVSGGTAPYNFIWSNGQTTKDLTNLNAGTYNCIISDTEGCSTNYNATIEDLGGDFAIFNKVITNENCNNGQGGINVTLIGCTEPISFDWDNGETTEDIFGLSAGTFSLIATDDNGCEVQTSADVLNIEGVLIITDAIITDENCGNEDGAIDITYTGAIEPTTFEWSNGFPVEDISELSSGDYSVTITDATGCAALGNYFIDNITNGFEITNSTIVDENCGSSDGTINLTLTGGSIPYIYSWNNGETTEDITGLSAGTYSCKITDATGCILSFSADITNITNGLAINFDNVINDVCNSSVGELHINATGGTTPYSYSWNTGATTQNLIGITTGTYIITVTDNTGCSTSSSFDVENEIITDFEFEYVDIYNDQCNLGDGTVQFEATPFGTYTYLLDGVESIIETGLFFGLTAGDYTISIIKDGCNLDSVITIENNTTFNVNNIIVTNEYCGNENGEIDISINPSNSPYTYEWSNGETTQDITGLSAGIYTCKINKLDDDCSDVISVEVGENSTMEIISNVSNENCGSSDGEINLFIFGGETPYSYDWSNGATTEDIENLSSGTYTCKITDNAGCSTTIYEEITNETNGLTINLIDITSTYCNSGDGSIDIIPIGGVQPYNFDWSNGATTEDISRLTVGNYSIILTDNLGCQTTETFDVTSSMGFNYIKITDDFCSMGMGEIFFEPIVPGSYTYELDGITQPTNWFENLSAGEHIISIVDGDCRVDSVVTVGNYADFDVFNIISTDEFCGDEQGAIDISVRPIWAEYSYNWSNGESTQNITGLSAGIYSCLITNLDSYCSDNIEVEVSNNTGTLEMESTVTDDNCSQNIGSIELTITSDGEHTVLWDNSATTEIIENLAAGDYSVVVTETSTGCELSDSFTIENLGSISVTEIITNSTCETCEDGAIDLTVTSDGISYIYDWSNGEITQDIFNLLPGNYTVAISNEFGCEFGNTYTVLDVLSIQTEEGYSLLIYPNPANDILNINYDLLDKQNAQLTILDLTGKTIVMTEINNAKGLKQINVYELANGIYFLEINIDGYSETIKFIKQ